ncbi:Gfo/Idh/MocA family oxidoreductase [Oceanobacillus sp. FSL W7-1293]|uniref:Gfo/Idh/MocA family oxidoreductase n=1 Tax=Oceanobacillus sp. FSL W7-1293 TaxID=2921699 RepID=UPI0030CE2305
MKTLNIGLIGAGRMGAFHGQTIAQRIPGAKLYAIADPFPQSAENVLQHIGEEAKIYTNPLDLIQDSEVDAIVIVSPARTHSENVIQAIEHGKPVFCEKPMAVSIEEMKAIKKAAKKNPVPVQVGFNRRFEKGFEQAHQEIVDGQLGDVQLLRSNTRDPELSGPEKKPEWTIFLETLIHDFDTLMYLNPGAKPVEVYAKADALIRPDLKENGLLDTSVVTITFDNGCIAVADASFQAKYGYDVRAEVFGSEGMITLGDIKTSSMQKFNTAGASYQTTRYDQDLLFDAYVDELKHFVKAVQNEAVTPKVSIEDAEWALYLALASMESVKTGLPVKVEDVISLQPKEEVM